MLSRHLGIKRLKCKLRNVTRLGNDARLALRRENIGGISTTHVACGAVVADRVPRLHAGEGASGAEVGDAADALGVLPDELREVAPVLEVVHARSTLAVVTGGKLVQLAVVPEVAGSLSTGPVSAKLAGAAGCSPHGEVLAVATTARSPMSKLTNGRRATKA